VLKVHAVAHRETQRCINTAPPGDENRIVTGETEEKGVPDSRSTCARSTLQQADYRGCIQIAGCCELLIVADDVLQPGMAGRTEIAQYLDEAVNERIPVLIE
jgi:hypothetical protein